METLGFVLLKWGTGHLDSLLFFVPLAILLIIWSSDHIIRYAKRKIDEWKSVYTLFVEENEFTSEDLMISYPTQM